MILLICVRAGLELVKERLGATSSSPSGVNAFDLTVCFRLSLQGLNERAEVLLAGFEVLEPSRVRH